MPKPPAFASIAAAAHAMEGWMTDEERAQLDGRLWAAELAIHGLYCIIVQHLKVDPQAVRHVLDSQLYVLEQARPTPIQRDQAAADAARAETGRLLASLETLPQMQRPAPPGPAP